MEEIGVKREELRLKVQKERLKHRALLLSLRKMRSVTSDSGSDEEAKKRLVAAYSRVSDMLGRTRLTEFSQLFRRLDQDTNDYRAMTRNGFSPLAAKSAIKATKAHIRELESRIIDEKAAEENFSGDQLFNEDNPVVRTIRNMVDTTKQMGVSLDGPNIRVYTWYTVPKFISMGAPIGIVPMTIGSYMVTVRVNTGGGAFRASTYVSRVPDTSFFRASGHYEHPHVSGDAPCLGSAAEPMHAAAKSGDFVKMIEIMDSHLGFYNAQSPYLTMDRWMDSNLGTATRDGIITWPRIEDPGRTNRSLVVHRGVSTVSWVLSGDYITLPSMRVNQETFSAVSAWAAV